MLQLIKYIIISIVLSTSLQSQFGKNIVQYDKFDWSYIKTEHFDIYYYNSAKQQAEFVAYYSEEAYNKISKLIGWELAKRSDIIVYNSHNDFQQSNVTSMYMEEGIGGVTELMKNRMVIPYDGSLKEFKHVIYHELVHVFINDDLYGGTFMNMIKNSNIIIPLWMNEGLAEYLAGEWDVNSDMWLRDLSINSDRFPNISILNGYLAYRGGQSLWNFITDKWGDEIIAEIFNNIKYKRDVNKGLEESLGIDIKELTSQWQKYLKKLYWPDIEDREDIQDISRQITNHIELYNNYNIAPEVSPDGTKIAMYSNKDGDMSIYIISIEDGEFLFEVATGQITAEYEELHILKPGISWSPDGDKLVFAAKSGKSDALFIVDVNKPKKKIKKVFNIEGIFRPTWNPINNTIAFIGYSNFASDIFIYNLDSDTLEQKTNDTFSDIQVSWSPDGKNLLFVSDRSGNTTIKSNLDIISITGTDFDNYDIYELDSENKITRLTSTPFNESNPLYSPNGEYVAFISDDSGINNIYITTDEFKTSKAITDVLTGITQLSWKNNSQIIFTGFYKSGYDIFLLSDIKGKVASPKNIKKSKWKSIVKKELLFSIDENNKDKNLSNYKHFEFSKNNLSSYSPIDEDKDMILLDSTGQHQSYKYKTRFTLDYAGAQFQYDFIEKKGQGMGTFLFSDILGNHRIAFQTSLVIDYKLTDLILQYVSLKNKTNWSALLYNYSYPGQLHYEDEDNNGIYDIEYFDLYRDVNLSFNLQNPFSKFSRIEGGLSHHYLEKKEERLNIYTNHESSRLKDRKNITSAFLKYVWDNTRPLSGNRTYVKYEITPKTSRDQIKYKKLTFDTRTYTRISHSSYITFASRVYFGSSWGRDRRVFGIGGAGYNTFFYGDDELLNPAYRTEIMEGTEYQYLSMNNFEFPVRGHSIAQKYGTHAMIYNLELRLPLLVYYFPAIKYLGQIFGVFFIDAGVAWNDKYPSYSSKENWDPTSSEGWIMSYGIGPRFNLFGFYWKLDLAWQYNPYEGKISDRKWYLSTGFDF